VYELPDASTAIPSPTTELSPPKLVAQDAVLGVAVGDVVGVTVGAAVGDAVGVTVGAAVGDAVGVTVGAAIGDVVGVTVGAAVGDVVGDTVGAAVGDVVGDTVGAVVGDAVGNGVGELVGTAASFTTARYVLKFGSSIRIQSPLQQKHWLDTVFQLKKKGAGTSPFREQYV
jgi:hypothetical protein